MNQNWHIVFQLLALATQFLVDDLPVAREWHPWLHRLGAFCNAALGMWALRTNPDGTPARVAYDPK